MPRGASNARGGGRLYTWEPTGERYWSVTTIIGGGIPKDALKWWAARTVAEFAYDEASNWLGMTRDRAIDYLKREPMRYTGGRADVGSAVHAAAEAIVLGRALPRFRELEERQIVAVFLDWTRHAKPTFDLVEASVYSRRQKYAGTLDGIAVFDFKVLEELAAERLLGLPASWADAAARNEAAGVGRVVRLILDYKTGGDVEEGKGVYPEVALQLAAYAGADFVGAPNGTEQPLPAVDGGLCVQLGARGWRMVPVRIDGDVFKAFLYAREVFRWQEQTSRTVLGDALDRIIPADEEVATS
jgi:hypothetical protein